MRRVRLSLTRWFLLALLAWIFTGLLIGLWVYTPPDPPPVHPRLPPPHVVGQWVLDKHPLSPAHWPELRDTSRRVRGGTT